MTFSSIEFLLLFLPITCIIYFNPICKSRGFRNVWLLIASLVFYAWGEPVFVGLMMLSILVTWILGLLIDASTGTRRKAFLTVSIIYHVAILFVFKYLTWIAGEVGLLLHQDFSAIQISLPIGISFFTFQLMSYVFDVYYGKASAQKNLLYLGLYLALFPQLIAGPIVRYETIAREITDREESFLDFEMGLRRFIVGLGKKVLLADYLGEIASQIFEVAGVTEVSVLSAWVGAICYSLEIYYDFSGYSDMAIGLGRIFGFHFLENFRFPYIADSITDFWRRWHISLTSWFRDYIYIPLGGNRVSKARHIRNLAIIWLITGIWHGANYTFILWGLIYFIFQVLEKYVYSVDGWPKWLRHVYTLLIVNFCWVIFKADSVGDAMHFIGCMLGGSSGIVDGDGLSYLACASLLLLLGIFFAIPHKRICYLQEMTEGKYGGRRFLGDVCLLAILLLCLMIGISGGYSAFIYFNF